jgi:hypothetical protein
VREPAYSMFQRNIANQVVANMLFRQSCQFAQLAR